MAGLEFLHLLYRHLIQIPVLNRPDHGHLDAQWDGIVLRLLENLHHPLAPIDLGLRFHVEI